MGRNAKNMKDMAFSFHFWEVITSKETHWNKIKWFSLVLKWFGPRCPCSFYNFVLWRVQVLLKLTPGSHSSSFTSMISERPAVHWNVIRSLSRSSSPAKQIPALAAFLFLACEIKGGQVKVSISKQTIWVLKYLMKLFKNSSFMWKHLCISVQVNESRSLMLTKQVKNWGFLSLKTWGLWAWHSEVCGEQDQELTGFLESAPLLF